MERSEFQKLLNIMKDVPYLIKFQGETVHANSLLNKGEIYMQSAQYYKELEMQTGIRGQGDIHENELFGFISVGMEFPIYCMYAVYGNQIQNNTIVINRKIIDDFCQDGGYITICKTFDFLRQFNQFCTSDDWSAGLVQYERRTVSKDIQLLNGKNTAHFFKREDLSYQQEFRIRINEPAERIELSEEKSIIVKYNGEKHYRDHTYKPRTEIIHDISAFSIQYTTKDLDFDGCKYLLRYEF